MAGRGLAGLAVDCLGDKAGMKRRRLAAPTPSTVHQKVLLWGHKCADEVTSGYLACSPGKRPQWSIPIMTFRLVGGLTLLGAHPLDSERRGGRRFVPESLLSTATADVKCER